MKKSVYVLGGLGADERVFQNLDPEIANIRILPWLPPWKDDDMQSYAARMASQVTESHPVIIGLSFGGMLAIEISRILQVSKIIQISSASHAGQLPALISFIRKTGLYKILPVRKGIFPDFLLFHAFGIRKKEDKALLKDIIATTDANFFTWAVKEIIRWKGRRPAKKIVQIHGDADRLIPIRNVAPDYVIRGGGHFMILTHADSISKILKELI